MPTGQDVMLLWMMGSMSVVAGKGKHIFYEEFQFQQLLVICFLESKTLKLQQNISKVQKYYKYLDSW